MATILNNLESILRDLEKNPIFEMLINIILVYFDKRNGTLLEYSVFQSPESVEHANGIINLFIDELRLYKRVDKLASNRYLVFKNRSHPIPSTDREIGQFLGFLCSDHDYLNEQIVRISGQIVEKITGHVIYTELCEKGRINVETLALHLEDKVKQFNELMKRLNLKYCFETRIQELQPWTMFMKPVDYTNRNFVRQNLQMYVNILGNQYYGKSLFVSNPQNVLKYFDLFVFIMDHIAKQTWDALYSHVSPGSERLNKINRFLNDLEKLLIHTEPSKYHKILKQMLRYFPKYYND